MASTLEKNTPTIPGSENLPHESIPSYQRVGDYPLVKDSLHQAYTLVQSNSSSKALYDRATALSLSILHRLEPLQKRLPLETVEGYAQGGLDVLEKHFPLVKTETGELIKTARKPADDAAGLARAYADGIQSRLSPVTEQFSARITQTQEAIQALQEKLSSTIASLPRDKASASEALNSIFHEVETLSTYVTTNAKELPATVQAKSQPLVDQLYEISTHVKEEIAKPDVPLGTKANNILSYSREQLTPLLTSIKELVIKKTDEAKTVVDEEVAPKVNGSH